MPELPEVETTKRGLAPFVTAQRIMKIELHRRDLRWPIPPEIESLVGSSIESVERRAKYLLMATHRGTALWHLGMSGSLRIVNRDTPRKTHDHVDWHLQSGKLLRFHDPRRFGSLLFQPVGQLHDLLRELGPEPLSEAFTAAYLFARSRKRSQAIKTFLMDQDTVVGVGNIYAAESLFHAGVRPSRQAHRVTLAECERIVHAIKRTLQSAIDRGGTTLRDFVNADGAPGYFQQELFVYGREGEPCRVCKSAIKAAKLGTRQSCYCSVCQK